MLGLVSFPLMVFVVPSLGAIACGLAALHFDRPGADKCPRILGLVRLTLGLTWVMTAMILRLAIFD